MYFEEKLCTSRSREIKLCATYPFSISCDSRTWIITSISQLLGIWTVFLLCHRILIGQRQRKRKNDKIRRSWEKKASSELVTAFL